MNLRKHLGVVVASTIATIAATIYLKNGAIFQDFAYGSFKFLDRILFGNKQTKPDHKSKLDKTASNFQPIKRL
jgi:hypothetical protein